MKRGAVVVMDALGFKGIWKRENAAAILAKLRTMQQGSSRMIQAIEEQVLSVVATKGIISTVDIGFLSDTVIITATVQVSDSAENRDWPSLLLASFATSAFLSLATREPPVLAYRGCIALGQFEMTFPFVVGEAVDEAAEYHDVADAAIVWFAPSTEHAMDRDHIEGLPATPFLPWSIPLKGGNNYLTHGVTPFFPGRLAGKNEDFALVRDDTVGEKILATFDTSRLDVLVKRQNTALFLEEARRRRP